MRSSRSGSETRQRQVDVRIRLNEEEIGTLDHSVARLGFRGQRARGDWVRCQLGLIPTPEPHEAAGHQRVPLPGGQALLAELGTAGTNLKRIAGILPAVRDGYLNADDDSRTRANLERWIQDAVTAITDAVEKVHARLDELGPTR